MRAVLEVCKAGEKSMPGKYTQKEAKPNATFREQ